ncbi:PREDICTED: uncharacterized protein LOC109210959 [Nicotiana attenuata]|uniref:uncharacterized protein LOC109210959 n=1 Tax=Nicotiana attenuata TaxID=49451 RepID=UPI0009049ECF|nr:PREDICTED: uncharacterized protein LOC109210959 [Nicotiana attenuata]
MSTVKTLIAVAIKKHWPMFQLDVNNAFLHGDLDEEVFMKLPPVKLFLPLLLFGSWFVGCTNLSMGSDKPPSNSMPSFLRPYLLEVSRGSIVVLVVYVDDIIFIGTDSAEISDLKSFLHHQFRIKDLGYPNYFLGIEVLYSASVSLYASFGSWFPFAEVFEGYCCRGSLVGWKSKKQPVVSMSSVEVEYRAMSKAVSEVTWLHMLLLDLGVPCSSVIPLFCDRQVAIHIAKNLVFHEHTKHIELDCHLVRTKLAEGLIQLLHTSSSTKLADILTKTLPGAAHHGILSKLGVLSPSNLKGGVGNIDISPD